MLNQIRKPAVDASLVDESSRSEVLKKAVKTLTKALERMKSIYGYRNRPLIDIIASELEVMHPVVIFSVLISCILSSLKSRIALL